MKDSKVQLPVGRKIYNEDVRKSRPDVLSHFPFSDETGTVTEVLGGQSEGERESKSGMHKLLLMGKPGEQFFPISWSIQPIILSTLRSNSSYRENVSRDAL